MKYLIEIEIELGGPISITETQEAIMETLLKQLTRNTELEADEYIGEEYTMKGVKYTIKTI